VAVVSRCGGRRDAVRSGRSDQAVRPAPAAAATRRRSSQCLTHCVVPSAPARSPREPLFMRALRDYVLVGSPFKTKCGNAARRRRTGITPLMIIVKLKATAAIPRTSSGTGMSVASCSSNSSVSATTGRDGLQPLVVVGHVQSTSAHYGTRRQATRAMCEVRRFVVSGCLVAYGPNYSDLARRTAVHVDQILKGAKPADLGVEQRPSSILSSTSRLQRSSG
jgi:hypothetical protein